MSCQKATENLSDIYNMYVCYYYPITSSGHRVIGTHHAKKGGKVEEKQKYKLKEKQGRFPFYALKLQA